MREILISMLLLFSFSFSAMAETELDKFNTEASNISICAEYVENNPDLLSPERLFNVTGETTQTNEKVTVVYLPDSSENFIAYNRACVIGGKVEVGWRSSLTSA